MYWIILTPVDQRCLAIYEASLVSKPQNNAYPRVYECISLQNEM
jgi:hypothetical protein